MYDRDLSCRPELLLGSCLAPPLRCHHHDGAAFVRELLRYYGTVGLPTSFHLRFPLLGVVLGAQAPSPWAKRGISQFPHEVLGLMYRVSDRAG
jgi:hypothetical protein